MKNNHIFYKLFLRLIFISIIFFNSIGLYSQTYELVWSDEFDYTGLPDATKWSYDVGGNGWGNSELQYYTNARTENARVENGYLTIEAHNETYSSNSYTSARLVTKQKGDWLYGRIEVRAKLPSGLGTWPAIWMLPTDWNYGGWPASGEIDIMEHVGYDPTTIYGTVHTQAYNHTLGTQVGSNTQVPDCESAFHIYAIEWDADKIDFYVDNTKYLTFNNEGSWEEWPFDKRFHLILNIAVGGSWGGSQGVDPSAFPVSMLVDYVRVYQDVSNVEIDGNGFVLPNEQNLIYTANQIVGASYSWEVPEDVELISGQGTNQIVVNWGNSDGILKAFVTFDDEVHENQKEIKLIGTPSGDEYIIDDFDDEDISGWSVADQTGNTFVISEQNSEVTVNYDIQNSNLNPCLLYTFERPFDLSEYSKMQIRMKTYNTSNSVNIRIDLVDVDGVETSFPPVFKLEPVYSDGQYHIYEYDFDGNWVSYDPYMGAVNSNLIYQMKMYVNYGFAGIDDAQDEFYIDYIKVLPNGTGIENAFHNEDLKIYPNPAKNIINVSLPDGNNFSDFISVDIYSLSGTNLFSQKYYAENSLEIDIHDFTQGIYLIKISNEKQIYSSRFIVNN